PTFHAGGTARHRQPHAWNAPELVRLYDPAFATAETLERIRWCENAQKHPAGVHRINPTNEVAYGFPNRKGVNLEGCRRWRLRPDREESPDSIKTDPIAQDQAGGTLVPTASAFWNSDPPCGRTSRTTPK